jgi:hypothetical protein
LRGEIITMKTLAGEERKKALFCDIEKLLERIKIY